MNNTLQMYEKMFMDMRVIYMSPPLPNKVIPASMFGQIHPTILHIDNLANKDYVNTSWGNYLWHSYILKTWSNLLWVWSGINAI